MAVRKEKTFYVQLNDGKIIENIHDLESFVPGEVSHFTNADQTEDMFFYSMRQSITPERDITCKTNPKQCDDENEPPLLDELEIYPGRILHKSMLILNPFHVDVALDKSSELIRESDLTGPIVFCLLFGVFLFVAGSKVHFGYIYGLSMISVCGMYALLLMITDGCGQMLNFVRVASAMGYGILPIVWLSILSIFVSFNSTFGIIIAMLCITLSTLGSSRMCVKLTNNSSKRLLIAYPCALVYIAFTFLVLF